MTQRYSDIDTTYLYTATQRIAGGLVAATNLTTNVYGNPEQTPTAPYWAVDVIDFDLQEIGAHEHIQTWVVASYLVYIPPENTTTSVYPVIWRALTQAFVYMQAHKRLVFDDTQAALKYLQSDDVQVNLQRINESHPGFAITHRLPYRMVLKQE